MSNSDDKHTILIVDDDPNNIRILEMDLEDENYKIITACDGVQGWEVLQKHKNEVKVILLDRMMPNMDGMEFMKHLKADETVERIPVIMQTAAAEREQVAQGIKAGVYYYLTKPYESDVMLSIVRSAVSDYAEYSQLREAVTSYKAKLHIIKECFFEVSTLDDVRYLSTFLSNFFPDPDRVIFGLSELLLNAVEHGNLGITYEEKSVLMRKNAWEEEVIKRQQLPEYCDKRVIVNFSRESDYTSVNIKDDGDGFDWESYLEIDPDRATHSHGRGIALSKMLSFDDMQYIGSGNEVLCKVVT